MTSTFDLPNVTLDAGAYWLLLENCEPVQLRRFYRLLLSTREEEIIPG